MTRVVTFFRAGFIFMVFLSFFGARIARADWDVKLPAGTRTIDGELISGRGLRDTTEAIAKELTRRGILHHQIGPYRFRAVEVTRFVSDSTSTTWLAIHVLRSAGKTVISFVARPKPLDEAAPSH